jgi:hypothetical protein
MNVYIGKQLEIRDIVVGSVTQAAGKVVTVLKK